MTTMTITGREPCLSNSYTEKSTWRLSLRNLASKLSILPPESISLEAAATGLHHKEYYVRYNMAKMLSRRGDRDARLIMEKALKKGNPPTRASTARFLHGFSWYAAEPLIQIALQDMDPRVREATVYSLCNLHHSSAYKLMAEVLKNEVEDVRAAAVWGLRHDRDSAAVAVLESVLSSSKDVRLRVKALEVLGMNDIPEAIVIVRRLIDDPHPDIKYAATLSWLELTEDRQLEKLANITENLSGEGLEQVLRALFHAANYMKFDITQTEILDVVLPIFESALNDDYKKTRIAVAWPLAWIRHPRAAALLKQAYYQEQDAEVKAHILYVSINLLSKAGDELLADGLTKRHGEVYEMARQLEQDLADGTIRRVYY
ncbi:MAG: hypothetical protein B6242_15235 [Anaerolineaceae bacterium 4572_78]|nr:MAG: hypothetical protein B6242_15235 [Anaerolineaceae bacterium 4572_78]